MISISDCLRQSGVSELVSHGHESHVLGSQQLLQGVVVLLSDCYMTGCAAVRVLKLECFSRRKGNDNFPLT